MPTRRDLVKFAGLSFALSNNPYGWAQPRPRRTDNIASELTADVVIIGGGVGGCAAALAAARAGASVILTEPTDWIGGQLTSQCLPAPDEHHLIEQFGRTASYARYRELVRDFYRQNYPITARARADGHLNPGDGWVSGLCHEPQVALSVLYQMLAPYLSNGRLTILLEHAPEGADLEGETVRGISVTHARTGKLIVLRGKFILDATETGELLPLVKAEFSIGSEGHRKTGELHASAEANANDIQSITYCFPVDYAPGQDCTIDKPAEYDQWRNYVPSLSPAWPGKLFDLKCSSPYRDEVRTFRLDPAADSASSQRFLPSDRGEKVEDLWTYRRIVSKHNFAPGSYGGSVTLVNWPQNDYWMGNIIGVSPEEVQRQHAHAKQLSLSLLYWMQTEVPRPDGGQGWPGIRLRSDIAGTSDGLAKMPYIRESRRIIAEFTVTEAHIGREQRSLETGIGPTKVRAATFKDSVGVGLYRMDAHPTTAGLNYVDIDALPHEIPLGSLIPVRMQNLLPACKNIGTTHVSSTAYREHPIEWNIGESVGMLAAYCIQHRLRPKQILESVSKCEDFQMYLTKYGVELRWPESTYAG